MIPFALLDPASHTQTYFLMDLKTREAVCIDPVASQLARDMAFVQAQKLTLRWVLDTHSPSDHASGAQALAQATGATHWTPRPGALTATLVFGDEQLLQGVYTPGHTQDSWSWRWGQQAFTGDLLLHSGTGRTDLPGGDADQLQRTLFTVLAWPDQTVIWPGHAAPGAGPMCLAQARAIVEQQQAQAPQPGLHFEAVQAYAGIAQDAASMPYWIDRQTDGYAGDVHPVLAHEWVRQGRAVLIDVRTDAERAWVGSAEGAQAVAWKQWPGMAMNETFIEQLQALGAGTQRLLMLCRSGVRSVAAAKLATAHGMDAWNVLEGFEGDLDAQQHRGQQGGWRWHRLPWQQG